MKRLLLGLLGVALTMPTLATAEPVPAEIATHCAEKWGSDYEMQLFCRERQMEALSKIRQSNLEAVMAQFPSKSIVVDENRNSAEGILRGYHVQNKGTLVCRDPYVIQNFISCESEVNFLGNIVAATSTQQVWVDTNGDLSGMAVIASDGSEVCRSPWVQNQFRGPDSYINCQ